MIEQPTAAPESPASVMTVTEFTGLVALITGMLTAMEARILGRLDDNSRHAAERWERHDADSKRVLADWDARFGRLEDRVETHLKAEEHEDTVWDARVGPLRTGLHILVKNWRSIALFLFGGLGFVAVLLDVITKYGGGS